MIIAILIIVMMLHLVVKNCYGPQVTAYILAAADMEAPSCTTHAKFTCNPLEKNEYQHISAL